MPVKIECPFTAEELREMYEAQRLSVLQISRVACVCRATAERWLIAAEITLVPLVVPMKPGKDWLWKKYWDEHLSPSEIGEIWAKMIEFGRPIHGTTVLRWMKQIGVPAMNKAEGLSRYTKSDKGREASRSHMKRVRAEAKGFKPHGPDHMKRMSKIAARKKEQECWEIRECCLPGCKCPVRRRRSRFNYSTWFCCVSHANQFGHARRKEQDREAELQRLRELAQTLAREKLARGY